MDTDTIRAVATHGAVIHTLRLRGWVSELRTRMFFALLEQNIAEDLDEIQREADRQVGVWLRGQWR